MKKTLFIVSTYYHALITCIKQLTSPCTADILVTAYIPDSEALSERLAHSGLFAKVIAVGEIREYDGGKFLHHRRNAALISSQLPFSMTEYNDIFIYHDNTWAARFLKNTRTPYHLIEDAYNCYKTISDTAFAYMVSQSRIKDRIKSLLRIGYVYCGADPATLSVEVNDISGIEIASQARGKLKEVPRKQLFDALTSQDVERLKAIFMKDIPQTDSRNTVLMLTQPLFADGRVSSETEQIQQYVSLTEDIPADAVLMIKPHPRDTLDYREIFPEAVILNKNMPAEMLKFAYPQGFSRIINISSTTSLF